MVISLFYITAAAAWVCLPLCVCSTELASPITDVIWQLGLRKRRVNICPLLPLSFVLIFFCFSLTLDRPEKEGKTLGRRRPQSMYKQQDVHVIRLINDIITNTQMGNRQEQSTITQRDQPLVQECRSEEEQGSNAASKRENDVTLDPHFNSSSTLAVSCS